MRFRIGAQGLITAGILIVTTGFFSCATGVASEHTADVVLETVEYVHAGVTLEGVVAYDRNISGKRPAVLIIHQWRGITDYERRRITMLAELGYVAFAHDMYGKGVRPENNQEASAEAGKYRADRALQRARAQAGVDFLRAHELVQANNIVAAGYCFGGGTALELARSGSDIKGFVSFHGNLDTPNPADANNIRGTVIVYHGAADPFVPKEQVDAFWQEMEAAEVDDWYLTMYANAVHSFTHKEAGTDPSTGSAYQKEADERSWEDFKRYLEEAFAQ